MKRHSSLLAAVPGLVFAAVCFAAAPGAAVQYHLERPQALGHYNQRQLDLLERLNRVDGRDLRRLSEIVVPDRWNLPDIDYSPMPQYVARFASSPKALIVDQPAQVFGAYEHGRLVRWGPVNTGKSDTPTPPGLYHLNWKSRLHTSSEDRNWKMPYYFNISNNLGIGLHEYTMPGKPSSHGCIRLLGSDAQWLFHWGQGSETRHGEKVANGAPVLVVGQYHFGSPKPWMQPQWLAHGVELPSGAGGAARSGGRG